MNKNNLDREKSALLIIDMQEDFARPSGSAYINGTQEIVSPLADMAMMFRKQKKNIFHVIRLYHSDGSNAELCRKEQILAGNRMVSPASKGAGILPELLPADTKSIDHDKLLEGAVIEAGEYDHILYKPRWGAFYNTILHDILQSKGITSLFIAGCNFPNCPRTSIYEASERDYRISIIPSTISGIYSRGLKEMKNIGVHVFDELLLVDFFLQSGITIADYHPSYKEAFKELNAAWLNQYFTIEPIDEYVLSDPEDAIIKNGGKILFALKDGQPIGTVALKIIADGRMELTKMAVDGNYQGLGIGKTLCQQAISVSKSLGMKELVLFSHTNLIKALALYRKLGFIETEIDKTKYKRADIMMTLQL